MAHLGLELIWKQQAKEQEEEKAKNEPKFLNVENASLIGKLNLIKQTPIITTVGQSYFLSLNLNSDNTEQFKEFNNAFGDKLNTLKDTLKPELCISLFKNGVKILTARRFTNISLKFFEDKWFLIIKISNKKDDGKTNTGSFTFYSNYEIDENLPKGVHGMSTEQGNTREVFDVLKIVECPSGGAFPPEPPPRGGGAFPPEPPPRGGGDSFGALRLSGGGSKKSRQKRRHNKNKSRKQKRQRRRR